MHPFSSALMHEMERAADAERRLEAQRRGLHLGDELPVSEPNRTALWLGSTASRFVQFLRSHALGARQPMEPAGS